MNHSNRYYILASKREDGKIQREYQEVAATRFKNDYGLDLFKHRDSHGECISEGRTGLKVYTGTPTDFNIYIENNGGIDKLNKLIEEAIEQYGLTPRYTEPDKRKEKKVKDENQVFSKYLYGKSKGYFIRFHNENGIELFRKKSKHNDDYFTVYAPCKGWMIPLGSKNSLESIVEKISNNDFSIHNWLVEHFEKQIADAGTWVDIGIAEYLDRLDEAKEHNAPIEAKRNAEREAERAEKAAKKESFIQEKQTEYENAIKTAEANIKNKARVKNETVVFYKDEFDYAKKSIFLVLFKKHNIDIPLKTQGWINNALTEVSFSSDGGTSYRYCKSSKDSIVFGGYLNRLVSAIKSE